MTVTVRLFAMLRERAGRDSVALELDDGATVADALRALAAVPGLREQLEQLPLATAVNRDLTNTATRLQAGDELALIPPVSGGADVHVAVGERPISAHALSRLVACPRAGAIVTFQGTTREVDVLDYDAYVEMAEQRIARILEECVARHDLLGVAAEHRVGEVPLGETSVAVAVSAAHRDEAFAGARDAIDRIKAEAPIWKREVGADGAWHWVAGTPVGALPAAVLVPQAGAPERHEAR